MPSDKQGRKEPIRLKEDETNEELLREIRELRQRYATATQYIRNKVNQLLTVMGTAPLRPEELDDETLIELDPISILSNSFAQVLRHLKETNEQLKVAHDEISAIFDSAGMGILVLDTDLRILACNRKVESQFGINRGTAVDRPCHEFLCHRGPGVCPAQEAIDTRKSCRIDKVIDDRHYNIVATPLLDKDGFVSRIVLVYMDMTERILAQENLRKSEERYRDLFENATDLIQVVGSDGSIRYVNRAWLETLGYGQEDIANLSIFDIIHPECDECGLDFKSVICGRKDGMFETMLITKKGETIIVEGNVSAVVEDGKFTGTRGIFRDITGRKRAENTIAAEREQLAVTLRSIGDGVITTDMSGNVVLINKVAERLTGWKQDQAGGRPISEVFHIVDQKTGQPCENFVEKVLKSGTVYELEGDAELISRDGSRRTITDSIAPILDKNSIITGSVLVFRDITDKRKLEERISKSEKIESLGVLAGGIAHDFNNLLTAIVGSLSMALKLAPPMSDLQKSLTRAEKASARAKLLTRQLLTFSKGGAPVKKLAAVSDLIRDTADFTVRGSGVRCQFSLPENLWNAEIDEGQISQVINNLVINAVQAMPQGGTVEIAARNAVIGPRELPELMPGNYVNIIVRDHGQGIAKEHIGRIFEPYFTTKSTGSGLGLATTYSIIKKHEGTIEVESRQGEGSVFSVYLPAALCPARTSSVSPITAGGKKILVRILLMDDDELVRETAGDILRPLGYRVDFAVHGDQALEMYREAANSGHPYDIVIMDLTIPGGKGGKETIKELLQIDPAARAIASSGYSNDALMANYRENGFAGSIVKPYTEDELREELERVIGKK